MSDPIVLGRVDKPEELDLEPVSVTIVGYRVEDREEVTETFQFVGMMPAGGQQDVVRHTDQFGNVPLSQIVKFLDECFLTDGEAEAFDAFLHQRGVSIEPGTVISLYRTLTEVYSGRPTRRPSASASTGQRAKRTSRAGARSAASTSKPSPQS